VKREPAVRGQRHVAERESNQTHIVFGTDLFPHRDPRRTALSIVVTLFGGGMSSRLFQRVREELGLAYGVYAFQQLYRSSGVVGVYVGTQPATADQATAAILAEYERLARHGLSREELDQGKQQFKGQVMLSLESPASRMNRLATVALHEEEYRPLDRILADIDAVTMDEVAVLTAEFFAPERQMILRLGPG
jgi:predicted Zn-dependent peptidase